MNILVNILNYVDILYTLWGLLAFFHSYGIILVDKFYEEIVVDQKIIETAVARTKEINASVGNFRKSMKLAVNEARLPVEQADGLLALVGQVFGKRSAEARARNKLEREMNKALYLQRLAEEMHYQAEQANEHICPVD